MPGINVKISKRADKLLVKKTSLFENLKENILFETEVLKISSWVYPEYPIKIFENVDFYIILEGYFYSRNNRNLENFLFQLANTRWSNNSNLHDFEWQAEEDAEFILLFYNKKRNEIIIQNDIQARLPLYYSLTDEKIIISRNFSYLREHVNETYSKLTLANYLLFGYPLKNDTLLKNVKRLSPASAVKINLSNMAIKLYENHNYFNFELKEVESNTKNEIRKIKNSFVQACEQRDIKGKSNILSLSGGLDSRLVGAGLYSNKTNFTSATLLDTWKVDSKMGSNEVDIAFALAERWNLDIKRFNSGAATTEDIKTLINLKYGLNHLGSSYLLRYLSDVKKEFGSDITFFTGDGGDKVIKYQLASNKLRNTNDVVNYILKFHHRFYIKQIVEFLNIDRNEIYENLIAIINDYPEKNFNYKYVHFILNERVRNWLFDAEDRNRHYYWSTTPFYSFPFFKTSMQSNDNIKSQNSLYIELLKLLDPGLESITYANTNQKINSKSALIYNISKNYFNKLPQDYRDLIKKILNKTPVYSENHNFIFNYVKEQVSSNNVINDYFNIDSILKLKEINHENLKMLFTITSILSNDDFSAISKNTNQNKGIIFN